MKRLACEMCGSTDLVKEEGVFVCKYCGCKYSVEEARKMMVEGPVDVQGTVKIDNTDQIANYLELATKAEARDNEKEAETYANKALELDPHNWKALYIKGKAAGWQSSENNDRLNEAIDCFTEATANCEDEEKLEQLKQDVASDISKLSLAMVDLRCNQFECQPSSEAAEAIRIESLNGTLRMVTLLVAYGISVGEYRGDAASRMNAAAMKAWSSIWKDYADGKPIQPTSSPSALYSDADRYRYSQPSKFDFDRFVERASACTKVIEVAIGFDGDNDKAAIARYENLLAIAPKIIEAKSVVIVPDGENASPKWATEYTLTPNAQQIWRTKIAEWEKAKKEAEGKVASK